jgi:hypothetical protein
VTKLTTRNLGRNDGGSNRGDGGDDRRSARGSTGGHTRGRRDDGSGRRSLDLAVGDLADGLDVVLRSSSNNAGKESDRDGRETHLDYVGGVVVLEM